MSVCRYQQKYQQATEHRPDKLTERVTRRCRAAEAKNSGELETSSTFRSSALSGKASTISKSISKTRSFLETKLEIRGRRLAAAPVFRELPSVWNAPRKEFPRARPVRADPSYSLNGRAAVIAPSDSVASRRRGCNAHCRVSRCARRTIGYSLDMAESTIATH